MATLISSKQGTSSKGVPGKWNTYSDGRKVFVAAKQQSGPADWLAQMNSQNAAVQQAYPQVGTPQQPGGDLSWRDGLYNSGESSITNWLNNFRSNLTGGQTRLAAELGVSYDPAPTADNPVGAANFRIDDNVDVTNPFSRAALLKRSYLQTQAGNKNSLAARGQLRSGALQNAQNRAAFDNQQGRDSILKAAGSGFGDLYKQWVDAFGSAEDRRRQNTSDAMTRARGY